MRGSRRLSTERSRLSRWRPGPARLARLMLGLVLFGAGEALLVASELGNSPWTVLAEGVALQTALAVGTATVVVSFIVLLLWIPLRQRPGLGTILNALVVGLAIDATLLLLPGDLPFAVRVLLVGIEITAVAIGFVLGGTVGVGTLAFALAIGPAVQAAVFALGGRDT